MSNAIAKNYDPVVVSELIKRCTQDTPQKNDLEELRQFVKGNPGILSGVLGLAITTQMALLSKISGDGPALRMAVQDDIKSIEQGLGLDSVPMLEKLLIENIVNTWLRLQWTEYQLAGFMGQSGIALSLIAWWEKRLSISQGRYLRAVETLARVRRLNLTLQVNVAQPGSQQLNVSGDLIAPPKGASGKKQDDPNPPLAGS